MKETGKLSRGFNSFRKNMKAGKKNFQSRSCKSCTYFYSNSESEEESCHNNGVTPYDMVDEGNNQFCSFWTPQWSEKK